MTHPFLVCPVCGDDVSPDTACRRCGHTELRDRPALCLPVGSVLHGEYTVGNPLGKPGGFGITYFAWYRTLEQAVAIKEYLPTDLAGRSLDSRTVKSHSLDHESDFRFGIEQFLREARTLARLNHPNIVRVRGFFEANGTAYLVMDYHAGQSVDHLLEARGGRLPEREAVGLLLPILDALQYVHQKNLLHRDVKPSNLYLEEDGTPLLLDFGAARSALSERTQSASLVHTPGYAPFEQYIAGGEQGPWTDVYATAATLYKLLTGVVPPNALERTAKDGLVPPERLVPGLSPGCSRAVMAGLDRQAEKRPQNAGELRKLLCEPGEPVAPPEPLVAPPVHPPVAPRMSEYPGASFLAGQIAEDRRPRRWPWFVAGGVLAAVALTLAVWGPKGTELLPGGIGNAAAPEQRINCRDGQAYVLIPAGDFQMGCTPESECADNEKPVRPVKIGKDFWLGATEVPVAAYQTFIVTESRRMPAAPGFNSAWEKLDHPIVSVSWEDAKAYCAWAGGRLPTEAEWEYAARGGLVDAAYPWGNEAPVCKARSERGARFDDDGTCNDSGPESVRAYAANAYGLYDMAGNVAEWTADRWHSSYKGAPSDCRAWTTGRSILRVVRGGSWNDYPEYVRTSHRSMLKSSDRATVIGFRCARDVAP